MASWVLRHAICRYRRVYTTEALVCGISHQECSVIAQSLQDHGFGVTSSRLLSEETLEAVKHKLPYLFQGEFETGVYPDEWHWR